jgi:hypothetical protein
LKIAKGDIGWDSKIVTSQRALATTETTTGDFGQDHPHN